MVKYHKAPRWLLQMQAKHRWTGKGRRKSTIDVVAALVEPAGAFPLLWSPEPLSFSRIDNHTHEIGAYDDYFSPSNVNSTLYNSGRRSLNIPQPCLVNLISSKSNSATSTSSSLSLASFTISPVGPAETHIFN